MVLVLLKCGQLLLKKTNEGRLPYIARAADAYNKILALDPMNSSAKSSLTWVP